MNIWGKLLGKIKWYLYVFGMFLTRIWPFLTIKAISRYSDQILFKDTSGFILSKTTANDLRYAARNGGYFFDCHEIRAYLNMQDLNFDVAIDVGANLGAVAYLLSKISRTVVSFEPSNSTFSQLEENIRLNKLDNVVLEEYACSNASGYSDLFSNKYHGHSSLSERIGLNKESKVRTIRLEDYLDLHTITLIDLLKIDVEGHELEVIQGLGRFLDPQRCKAIIWEHSLFADSSGQKSLKIYDTLFNAGYQMKDLKGKSITSGELVMKDHLDVLATA